MSLSSLKDQTSQSISTNGQNGWAALISNHVFILGSAVNQDCMHQSWIWFLLLSYRYICSHLLITHRLFALLRSQFKHEHTAAALSVTLWWPLGGSTGPSLGEGRLQSGCWCRNRERFTFPSNMFLITPCQSRMQPLHWVDSNLKVTESNLNTISNSWYLCFFYF